MFENGEIFRKSKKIERTDSCDIEVIEHGLGKKSRNIFKEMEVESISKDVSISFTNFYQKRENLFAGDQLHQEQVDRSQERTSDG